MKRTLSASNQKAQNERVDRRSRSQCNLSRVTLKNRPSSHVADIMNNSLGLTSGKMPPFPMRPWELQAIRQVCYGSNNTQQNSHLPAKPLAPRHPVCLWRRLRNNISVEGATEE